MTKDWRRLVVYTVLIGDKEPLGDPLAILEQAAASDLEIDFVCFTNNRALKSKVWQFRYLDDPYLPAEKLSRRPKALPHEYLTDWDVSIYIDNIVAFKRLPTKADLATARPYLLRVYRHATRSHPGEEADVIVMTGYDETAAIVRQLDFYRTLYPVETISPLSTCTVILRTHHHPAVKRMGVLWWEQILNFSKRDQMSFDFSVHHSGCQIELLPGMKHDNDLIHNPVNSQKGRVKASFDPVLYAWRHRSDPLAQRNPRAHFLANGSGSDDEYARRSELFEYICHRCQSSLGSYHAPRRRVANALQDELAEYRERNGQMLLVRFVSASPDAFSGDEFEAAKSAFGMFMSGRKSNFIELSETFLESSNEAIELGGATLEVVVVLDVASNALDKMIRKLGNALSPSQGVVVAIASDECSVEDIAKATKLLTSLLRANCTPSVLGSAHDNRKSRKANSVICFHWQSVGATCVSS